MKSLLLDGQLLSEKCESQTQEIVQLRYEIQGLHHRKSTWKEKYWKADSKLKLQRQHASQTVGDLEGKVRQLEEQVQDLEVKLERVRCSICLVSFSNMALSCGHIFCQGCLIAWEQRCLASVEPWMTCPVCRVKSDFNLRIYETT